jgi:hypothetical protein
VPNESFGTHIPRDGVFANREVISRKQFEICWRGLGAKPRPRLPVAGRRMKRGIFDKPTHSASRSHEQHCAGRRGFIGLASPAFGQPPVV